MAANYNNSAWFYDSLSQLIYGRALLNAQIFLLQFIPVNSRILIVGGGTGKILDEIIKIHSSGLQVTYVEVAAGMMARSKKRNTGNNKVIFVNDAIENITLPPGFDVVITPFLFDNFKETSLDKIFNSIHSLLKTGGLWLNADFQLTGKWWQNFLLKSMFLFFRMLCGIEASKLPDIDSQFVKHGYEDIAKETFFGDFVISKVFKRR